MATPRSISGRSTGWERLPHDPAHPFEANIFYPERHTLAYSEMMLVQGALAVPIVEVGGSPLLAFNVVLLAGLAFTGWAFCLLVQRWTGSWIAGFLAGSLAAFNAHDLVRFGHLQEIASEGDIAIYRFRTPWAPIDAGQRINRCLISVNRWLTSS